VIQVASLEQNWRGLYLEAVGSWFRGTPTELGFMETEVHEGKLTLYVASHDVRAGGGANDVALAIYNENDYQSRHRNLLISQKMQGKKVVLVAVGTIGSKMALELAKHGVEVSLIDPGIIEIENPYRMGMNLPPELLVGLNKCYAMAKYIQMIIPNAKVSSYPIDVSRSVRAFSQLIDEIKPDIIILSTDTRDSIRDTNAVAREHLVPVLHIALSDGAESGQIHFMSAKPDDPCLMCMMPEDENPSGVRDSRRQYAETDSQAQAAVPSLSIDTTIIASIATKILMAFLAGEDIAQYFTVAGNTGQVMWFSTTPDTWILQDAFQKLTATVEKYPQCRGCSKPDKEAILAKHKQRKERMKL